jgi:hypothetical protein
MSDGDPKELCPICGQMAVDQHTGVCAQCDACFLGVSLESMRQAQERIRTGPLLQRLVEAIENIEDILRERIPE